MSYFGIFFITMVLPMKSMANTSYIPYFLNLVTKNSLSYELYESQYKERIAANQALTAPLEGTTTFGTQASQAKPVPSPQVAINNQQTYGLSAGYQSLWASGWRTQVSYNLDHTKTELASGNFDAYQPDLKITASTNIFQDFLSDRFQQLEQRQQQSQTVIEVETKQRKKQHLISALLNLAGILEVKDELTLQRRLCNQVSQQTKQLKVKNSRGTVRKRDYLQSQKELISCQGLVKALDKELISRKDALYSQFRLDFDKLDPLDIRSFYRSVEKTYSSFADTNMKADIQSQPSLKTLSEKAILNKMEIEDLEAQNEPHLELQFTAGLKGSDADFSESQSQVFDSKYPYISVGLNYQLPVNGSLRSQLRAKHHRLKALELEQSIEKNALEGRYRVLSQTLSRDFSIYRDRLSAVNLSENILDEAKRDFENGRLDFNTLTEFQKGLLQSQQNLASIRIQVIRSTIEYIDFFNFFESYY